jgi:hypothetical protein
MRSSCASTRSPARSLACCENEGIPQGQCIRYGKLHARSRSEVDRPCYSGTLTELASVAALSTEALSYLEQAKAAAEGREAEDTAELWWLYREARPSGATAPAPATEPTAEEPAREGSETAADPLAS